MARCALHPDEQVPITRFSSGQALDLAPPHALELVDQLDIGADAVDAVDLDNCRRRSEVDLGEIITDEIEAEEVQTQRVELLRHSPARFELSRRRFESRRDRALV